MIPKFSWHFHLRKRGRERKRGHKNSFWERREKAGKREEGRNEEREEVVCSKLVWLNWNLSLKDSSPFVYSPPRKGRGKVRCVVSREFLQETCILRSWATELKRERKRIWRERKRISRRWFLNSLMNQSLRVTLEPSQWKVTVTHEQCKQTNAIPTPRKLSNAMSRRDWSELFG